MLHQLLQVISYRQKIILTELSRDVYPIRCIDSNAYSIVDIRLPRADDPIFDASSSSSCPSNEQHVGTRLTAYLLDRDRDIGAALGFCSHLVLLISHVIQLPLRFPIIAHQPAGWKIYDESLDMHE